MASRGVALEQIQPKSAAEKAGLQTGDTLVSINRHALTDSIDFMFYCKEPELDIVALRKGKKIHFKIFLKENEDIGITLSQFKIRRCNNNCLFCFVSQLPKGLRKTLYIKDEDYRMSFLYGNYITLTNLSSQDKKRIASQRLSPLYISVHSTSRSVRNTLLGSHKACDILKELRFFKENKIRMHTQIVLCPGYNDGKELEKTIRDLYGFYPYVSSIAVVPVGLTAHRRQEIRQVEKQDAVKAIEIIDSFQKRFRKKHGETVVYGADELYLRADASFPALKEYGELPQIENGVGMVPLFLSQAKRLKMPEAISRKKRFLTFTGVSFYPYFKKIAEKLLEKDNVKIDIVPVENTFFGKTVTVTGLLTGRDIIRAFADKTEGYECLIVPDVVLKDGKEVFLDDISKKDVEQALEIPLVVVKSTPEGILDGISFKQEE